MDGITLQEMSDETVQQLQANYVRQPAYAHTEGTAAAYTVTLDPAPKSLADGFGITIVPHVSNETEVTLNINGLGAIALKDQKGIAYTAGKLQAGKPYMFRKVGTDFLADSSGGSGNAIAGDIRAGKTATTDNGDVVGTLPVRTGGTVVPSTVNQTRQKGIYDSDIVVQGSPNLRPDFIVKGIEIFGVVGSYSTFFYASGTGKFDVPANGAGYVPRGAISYASACYVSNTIPAKCYAIADMILNTNDYYLKMDRQGRDYRVVNNSNYKETCDYIIQGYST